jgi:hypothetical protein
LKSDLEIPQNTSKFISLYLLLSIGFKGGQELAHSHFTMDIIWSVLFGVTIATLIPIYCFFILKLKFSIENSVQLQWHTFCQRSNFVTAVTFLEMQTILSVDTWSL